MEEKYPFKVQDIVYHFRIESYLEVIKVNRFLGKVYAVDPHNNQYVLNIDEVSYKRYNLVDGGYSIKKPKEEDLLVYVFKDYYLIVLNGIYYSISSYGEVSYIHTIPEDLHKQQTILWRTLFQRIRSYRRSSGINIKGPFKHTTGAYWKLKEAIEEGVIKLPEDYPKNICVHYFYILELAIKKYEGDLLKAYIMKVDINKLLLRLNLRMQ